MFGEQKIGYLCLDEGMGKCIGTAKLEDWGDGPEISLQVNLGDYGATGAFPVIVHMGEWEREMAVIMLEEGRGSIALPEASAEKFWPEGELYSVSVLLEPYGVEAGNPGRRAVAWFTRPEEAKTIQTVRERQEPAKAAEHQPTQAAAEQPEASVEQPAKAAEHQPTQAAAEQPEASAEQPAEAAEHQPTQAAAEQPEASAEQPAKAAEHQPTQAAAEQPEASAESIPQEADPEEHDQQSDVHAEEWDEGSGTDGAVADKSAVEDLNGTAAEVIVAPEANEDLSKPEAEEPVTSVPRGEPLEYGPRTALKPGKWEQLKALYPVVAPFGDSRIYLKITPGDFVILKERSYKRANNSFLLHGYFQHKHLILHRVNRRGQVSYYLGVPGTYYDREKEVALLFGFQSFEGSTEPAREGDFGYYMMQVEL